VLFRSVLQYCGGIAGLAGGGCAKTAAAVTTQPFFEAAMNPAYCKGFANCTAAVVANEGGNLANAQVWSMWSDLDAAGFNFGTTMMNNTNAAIGATSPQMTSGPADNGSYGFGNYNGGFASLKMADWKGFTMQSNFTYSKALGTGAVTQSSSSITPDDAFNLKTMYGYQNFNRKFVYNFFFVYQPPFYKGQSGMMGRLLGGWTFSSVFSAGSGTPFEIVGTTGAPGQEYGSGDASAYFSNANVIQIAPIKSGHVYSQPNGAFANIFASGPAAINDFRNPILGLDPRDGGNGNVIGLPYWNMDLSVRKNILVAERISLEFQGVFANIFNHNQWLDPDGIYGTGLFAGSGPNGFGTLSGGSAQEEPGGNRQIEVGLRVRF
jgi:hypothetical protein